MAFLALAFTIKTNAIRALERLTANTHTETIGQLSTPGQGASAATLVLLPKAD